MSNLPPTSSPARPSARAPLTFLALAGAGVLAAGVGGYVAQSHRQTELPTVDARAAQSAPAAATPSPTPASEPPRAQPDPVLEPVAEPARESAAPSQTRDSKPAPAAEPVERTVTRPLPAPTPSPSPAVRGARTETSSPAAPQASVPAPPARTPEPAPAIETQAEAPAVAEAPPPPTPEPAARPQSAKVSIAETFTIPADSVMGLELDRTVSSDTAQVEDRIDARVTRDVKVDGSVVIPAGSRVRGDVIQVENGGRFKDRGRLGIRFHTLTLADGDTVTIETDPLFREGENIAPRTSARIGASAAGGAIIGAIFGGQKGAAIGAAAGAGAGTAATAAQKPSEARFRAGSVVTVRLTAPVSITLAQ